MNISNTQMRLVLAGTMALLLAACFAYAIYTVRAANTAISQLALQAESVSKKEKENQAIRTARLASEADIQAFEKIPLSGNGVVGVIESLEAAGKSLNLDTNIVSVNDVEGEKGNAQKQILIVIEGEGSWTGAYSLVKAVESLPQRVILKSVELSKNDALWKTRIGFSIFSFNN